MLSKDQEEPRTTTGNKKKRCKSSGDTSSHGDNLTPTGVATVSSGPRVKKDLLTLPLNCPDEVVASQVKRNKVKRTGKSSLLVDFDEERSDKSDETDATSTKEHRQSKDSAGEYLEDSKAVMRYNKNRKTFWYSCRSGNRKGMDKIHINQGLRESLKTSCEVIKGLLDFSRYSFGVTH